MNLFMLLTGPFDLGPVRREPRKGMQDSWGRDRCGGPPESASFPAVSAARHRAGGLPSGVGERQEDAGRQEGLVREAGIPSRGSGSGGR